MKKFERFIIYPMLFIALFFSFADDGVQQTTAQKFEEHIITKRITITDGEGNRAVDIFGDLKSHNGIYLYNPSGNETMRLINNSSGKPGILLKNNGKEPVIVITDAGGKTWSNGMITGYANGESIYNLYSKIDKEGNTAGSLETYDNSNGSKTSIIGSSVIFIDGKDNVKDGVGIFDE